MMALHYNLYIVIIVHMGIGYDWWLAVKTLQTVILRNKIHHKMLLPAEILLNNMTVSWH